MPDESSPIRSTTPRGFKVYDNFIDSRGSEVRVQQSSTCGHPHVWIFAVLRGYDDSAHLTVEQAKRVRDALDAFIAENKDEPDNTDEINKAMLEAAREMGWIRDESETTNA